MLTVCCFKWASPHGYRSRFGPEHVLTLQAMVGRHYPHPHRFVCVTDDPGGLADVETIPLWPDYAMVPSPHGGGNPSCYRRLKLFDPRIDDVLGSRFVTVDLDTVIVGDLTPIFDRSEPFVIWGETNPRSWYNGSMMLLTAGARPQVWTHFDPLHSPQQALSAGKFGSDQGWISYCLGPGEATWTTADGVYSYRVHVLHERRGQLPADARLVMFHGKVDPWSPEAQQADWVRVHYRV